jgi:hypothetical protein
MIVGDLLAPSAGSHLWVTFDGGAHWKQSAGVPKTAFVYSATISRAGGNTVLAMSVDSANNVFVLRSVDGGTSYKRVATLANAPAIGVPVDPESALRSKLWAFVYSPAREIRFNDGIKTGTPDVVATTQRGAFLSTDLGTTWHRIDGSLIAHGFWGTRWVNGYLDMCTDGEGTVRSAAPLQ